MQRLRITVILFSMALGVRGAPAPQAAAAAFEIAGRIETSAGSAIPQAAVRVKLDRDHAREACAPILEFVAVGASLPDGSFRISVPAAADAYELLVQAEGFAPRMLRTSTRAPIVVILHVGGSVRWRVLEEDTKRPIPNALVSTGVQTGTDGQVLESHLPPGEMRARITHPLFIPSRWQSLRIEDGVVLDQDIYLSTGHTLSGTVCDASKAPIVGAEVRLSTVLSVDDVARGSLEDEKTATTDSLGHFEFKGVQRCSMTLLCCAIGFSHAIVHTDGKEGRITRPITLGKGVPITGRASDINGRPVAGVIVSLESTTLQSIACLPEATESGADGAFAFPLMPRWTPFDDVVLRANKAPYAEARIPLAHDMRNSRHFEVVLAPRASISGTLEDEDGMPLGAGRVELWNRMERTALSLIQVERSGSDGRFVFSALSDGQYEVRGNARGYVAAVEPANIIRGNSLSGIRCRIKKGRPLRGLVVDENALPVAEAQVQLWDSMVSYRTSTSPDGSFIFEGVGEGPWSIHVQRDGIVPQSCEGVIRSDGIVKVQTRRQERLRVRVIDAVTMEPIEQGIVSIVADDAAVLHVEESGQDGIAEIDMERGNCSLVVWKGGAERVVRRCRDITGRSITIMLGRAGVICGELPLPRFAEPSPIYGRRRGEQSLHRLGMTDRRGRFRIDGVPLGEWEVHGVPKANERLSSIEPPLRGAERFLALSADPVVVEAGRETSVEFGNVPSTVLRMHCVTKGADTRPAVGDALSIALRLRSISGMSVGIATKDGYNYNLEAEVVLTVTLVAGRGCAVVAIPEGSFEVSLLRGGSPGPDAQRVEIHERDEDIRIDVADG